LVAGHRIVSTASRGARKLEEVPDPVGSMSNIRLGLRGRCAPTCDCDVIERGLVSGLMTNSVGPVDQHPCERITSNSLSGSHGL
jgi:hypothetical protein